MGPSFLILTLIAFASAGEDISGNFILSRAKRSTGFHFLGSASHLIPKIRSSNPEEHFLPYFDHPDFNYYQHQPRFHNFRFPSRFKHHLHQHYSDDQPTFDNFRGISRIRSSYYNNRDWMGISNPYSLPHPKSGGVLVWIPENTLPYHIELERELELQREKEEEEQLHLINLQNQAQMLIEKEQQLNYPHYQVPPLLDNNDAVLLPESRLETFVPQADHEIYTGEDSNFIIPIHDLASIQILPVIHPALMQQPHPGVGIVSGEEMGAPSKSNLYTKRPKAYPGVSIKQSKPTVIPITKIKTSTTKLPLAARSAVPATSSSSPVVSTIHIKPKEQTQFHSNDISKRSPTVLQERKGNQILENPTTFKP